MRFLFCFTGLLLVIKGVTSYFQKTHKLKQWKTSDSDKRSEAEMSHFPVKKENKWQKWEGEEIICRCTTLTYETAVSGNFGLVPAQTMCILNFELLDHFLIREQVTQCGTI